MPTGTDPIRLGSAAGTDLIFETGSRISTSKTGIQSFVARFFGPTVDDLNSYLDRIRPGSSFPTGLPTTIPPGFISDFENDVEYLEGRAVRLTVPYVRLDPNRRRDISVSTAQVFSLMAAEELVLGRVSFPEPVVTVRYASDTAPAIAGGLLYVTPGTTAAEGFPPLNDFFVQVTNYASPTDYTIYRLTFTPNPLGWQLVQGPDFTTYGAGSTGSGGSGGVLPGGGPSVPPSSGSEIYDVTLVYRTYYQYAGFEIIPH